MQKGGLSSLEELLTPSPDNATNGAKNGRQQGGNRMGRGGGGGQPGHTRNAPPSTRCRGGTYNL